MAYKLIGLADEMLLDFETVADFDEDYVPAWKRMATWLLRKHRAIEGSQTIADETVVDLRLLRTHSATTEMMQTEAVPAHEAVSVPEAVPADTVRKEDAAHLAAVAVEASRVKLAPGNALVVMRSRRGCSNLELKLRKTIAKSNHACSARSTAFIMCMFSGSTAEP